MSWERKQQLVQPSFLTAPLESLCVLSENQTCRMSLRESIESVQLPLELVVVCHVRVSPEGTPKCLHFNFAELTWASPDWGNLESGSWLFSFVKLNCTIHMVMCRKRTDHKCIAQWIFTCVFTHQNHPGEDREHFMHFQKVPLCSFPGSTPILSFHHHWLA